MLRRTITPVVRVLDERQGIVEYNASDPSVDTYREVISPDGWRFDRFTKNAPFVDSHCYDSIDKLLGKVVDFRVRTASWLKRSNGPSMSRKISLPKRGLP